MEKGCIEKRRFQRAMARVPIKYYKVGDSGSKALKASTISRNLSEGGVHFRTVEFVSRACRLMLEIEVPMFSGPLKAISRVAWIRKVDSGDEYEMGNQFLEISDEDRKRVVKYVDSLTTDDGTK